MAPQFAETPKPPYYAVIFTSLRTQVGEEYAEWAERMLTLAKGQEGFLGVESAREELGITVSYWRDRESIRRWRENLEHLHAQYLGRERWYEAYRIRIARVEEERSFEREEDGE